MSTEPRTFPYPPIGAGVPFDDALSRICREAAEVRMRGLLMASEASLFASRSCALCGAERPALTETDHFKLAEVLNAARWCVLYDADGALRGWACCECIKGAA